MNFFHDLVKQNVWNSWKNTGLFFSDGKSAMVEASISSSSDFSSSAFSTGIKHEYCSTISAKLRKEMAYELFNGINGISQNQAN